MKLEEKLKEKGTDKPYYYTFYLHTYTDEERKRDTFKERMHGTWDVQIFENIPTFIPAAFHTAMFNSENEAKQYIRNIRKEYKLNIKKI